MNLRKLVYHISELKSFRTIQSEGLKLIKYLFIAFMHDDAQTASFFFCSYQCIMIFNEYHLNKFIFNPFLRILKFKLQILKFRTIFRIQVKHKKKKF